MSPDTTANSPDFNGVRRALQLESLAPDVARDEAEVSPSLHVEVEEEGSRDLGNSVQSPVPLIAITTNEAQLNPTSLADTPMDAAATIDLDILRSSLEAGKEERLSWAAADRSRRDRPGTAGPRKRVARHAGQDSRPSSRPRPSTACKPWS